MTIRNPFIDVEAEEASDYLDSDNEPLQDNSVTSTTIEYYTPADSDDSYSPYTSPPATPYQPELEDITFDEEEEVITLSSDEEVVDVEFEDESEDEYVPLKRKRVYVVSSDNSDAEDSSNQKGPKMN